MTREILAIRPPGHEGDLWRVYSMPDGGPLMVCNVAGADELEAYANVMENNLKVMWRRSQYNTLEQAKAAT